MKSQHIVVVVIIAVVAIVAISLINPTPIAPGVWGLEEEQDDDGVTTSITYVLLFLSDQGEYTSNTTTMGKEKGLLNADHVSMVVDRHAEQGLESATATITNPDGVNTVVPHTHPWGDDIGGAFMYEFDLEGVYTMDIEAVVNGRTVVVHYIMYSQGFTQ